jgi:hypothetical protein
MSGTASERAPSAEVTNQTVRRMAVSAAVHNRFVFPQERAALLCVACGTRLVLRLLYEERGAIRAMRVVTARASDFSFEDRMPREAMNLSLLCFMASSTHGSLGQRVQHFLLHGVPSWQSVPATPCVSCWLPAQCDRAKTLVS